MHAPRKEKWQEKLKRSRYLIGAIVFHLILFFMLATLVIWPVPPPAPTKAFLLVNIKPPLSPPLPPPTVRDGGGSSELNPQAVIAHDVSPPSVITSVTADVTVDTSNMEQTLDHLGNTIGNGPGPSFGDGSVPGAQLMAQLQKLLFQLPCLSLADPHTARCPLTDDHSFVASVSDDKVHTCTMRVRGVVELSNYDGGKTIGNLNIGGSPNTGLSNIYELKVNNPPQIYYLNTGNGEVPVAIDYAMKIQIKNNSQVRLHADSIDYLERSNSDNVSAPDNIPGHPIGVKQPYNGQFIQVDAISVDN